jgi:transporter family protein
MTWQGWAASAAALYGAHQIFTRLAADRIGDAPGGLVVESTAALTILIYFLALRAAGIRQPVSAAGVGYSALTGVCVGIGTIAFFILFQKGGPLSAVPAILAVGAAIMAIGGVVVFHETLGGTRALGIALSIAGLFLLRK